jgi:tripeptidyl-peptidase-1
MFDGTTEEVEALFKADYHVYEHEASGSQNIACDEYHLPGHVQEHVDYVTPGIKLLQGTGKAELKKAKAKRAGGHLPPSSHVGKFVKHISEEDITSKKARRATAASCNSVFTPDCTRCKIDRTVTEVLLTKLQPSIAFQWALWLQLGMSWVFSKLMGTDITRKI